MDILDNSVTTFLTLATICLLTAVVTATVAWQAAALFVRELAPVMKTRLRIVVLRLNAALAVLCGGSAMAALCGDAAALAMPGTALPGFVQNGFVVFTVASIGGLLLAVCLTIAAIGDSALLVLRSYGRRRESEHVE